MRLYFAKQRRSATARGEGSIFELQDQVRKSAGPRSPDRMDHVLDRSFAIRRRNHFSDRFETIDLCHSAGTYIHSFFAFFDFLGRFSADNEQKNKPPTVSRAKNLRLAGQHCDLVARCEHNLHGLLSIPATRLKDRYGDDFENLQRSVLNRLGAESYLFKDERIRRGALKGAEGIPA